MASRASRLAAVLFVQRHWKSKKNFDSTNGNGEDSRVYLANCCATPKLKAAHIAELKAAIESNNDKTRGLTKTSVEALFKAYDVVKGSVGSLEDFKKLITDASEGSADSGKAHDLLVEAASSLPYQGQLPSACDKRIAAHQGIWCRVKNTDISYLKWEPAFVSESKAIEETQGQDDVTFLGVGDADQDGIKSATHDFINSFMLGVPPADSSPCYKKNGKGNDEEQSILAIPCCEKWTPNGETARAGAFIGWVFLVFTQNGTNPSSLLQEVPPILRLSLNHFAERELAARDREIRDGWRAACVSRTGCRAGRT